MVTGGDQDLKANSETPRERANRLRRERRASLSAAKKDAAAQLRHDHGSLRQEERGENLPEPINQEEAKVTGGDQDLQGNSETPQDRANRLRREHRVSLSAAKKDAAAQLRRNQESTLEQEPDQQPLESEQQEATVVNGDRQEQARHNVRQMLLRHKTRQPLFRCARQHKFFPY